MAEHSGYSKFIEAVAGDGKTAPDVRVLTGWLGPAGDDNAVRLYLDASLGTFVDIARDAVLYSEEIPDSHPAGARTVWVRNDAELREGGSALARAARFLSGPVQDAFGAQARPGGPGVQQFADTRICLTFKPGCESVLNPCITRTETPDCRFTNNPCSAIDACPSALVQCETRPGDRCAGPTHVAAKCFTPVQVCPTPRESIFIPCIPPTESGPQCFNTIDLAAVSAIRCQTAGWCPSAVDACPSALGCTFACNFDPRTIQQQFGPQQFAPQQFGPQQFAPQQFVGAKRTVPITITASGPLCPFTTIGCPDPNPSVQQACGTLKPALCPSAPQACPMPTPNAQVAAFGWTSLGCNQPTHYPQCNSSIGICATRPPCF